MYDLMPNIRNRLFYCWDFFDDSIAVRDKSFIDSLFVTIAFEHIFLMEDGVVSTPYSSEIGQIICFLMTASLISTTFFQHIYVSAKYVERDCFFCRVHQFEAIP